MDVIKIKWKFKSKKSRQKKSTWKSKQWWEEMNNSTKTHLKWKVKKVVLKIEDVEKKKSIFNNAPPASNSCECKIVFLKFVFIIRQDVTNIFLKIKSSNFGYGEWQWQ